MKMNIKNTIAKLHVFALVAQEAMAFVIPCVGFNLKAYESYYPKGMIKVPITLRFQVMRST